MTLGELRTLFKDWLTRTDCTDALADTFIGRAQARMEREIRIAPMERAIEVTDIGKTGLSEMGLPADFIATQYLVADGNLLEPVPFRTLLSLTAAAGCPRFFSRLGNKLLFRPYPTQSVSLSYYGNFGALTADTDSNVLTNSAPFAMIFAALSYAGDFFRMDEMTTWEQRYQAERDALVQQSADADMFASPQAITPDPEVMAYL